MFIAAPFCLIELFPCHFNVEKHHCLGTFCMLAQTTLGYFSEEYIYVYIHPLPATCLNRIVQYNAHTWHTICLSQYHILLANCMLCLIASKESSLRIVLVPASELSWDIILAPPELPGMPQSAAIQAKEKWTVQNCWLLCRLKVTTHFVLVPSACSQGILWKEIINGRLAVLSFCS